jgi:hypothetical protein
MARPPARPGTLVRPVRPLRLLSLAGVLVAVAVVSTACSQSQSPAAEARAVLERFYSDLENGSGAAACSLLTPAAREEAVSTVARPLHLTPSEYELDCERVLDSDSRATARNAAFERELRATKFGSVSVNAGQAMVVVNVPHVGLRAAPLTQTPDGWRISQFSLSTRKPISG